MTCKSSLRALGLPGKAEIEQLAMLAREVAFTVSQGSRVDPRTR